jgi:hypothetical protein
VSRNEFDAVEMSVPSSLMNISVALEPVPLDISMMFWQFIPGLM